MVHGSSNNCSLVIEQLFVRHRSIVHLSPNHCSLELEERFNHMGCQMAGKPYHFILSHAHILFTLFDDHRGMVLRFRQTHVILHPQNPHTYLRSAQILFYLLCCLHCCERIVHSMSCLRWIGSAVHEDWRLSCSCP